MLRLDTLYSKRQKNISAVWGAALLKRHASPDGRDGSTLRGLRVFSGQAFHRRQHEGLRYNVRYSEGDRGIQFGEQHFSELN